MAKKSRPIHIFEGLGRELRTSVAIAVAGFILMWLLIPVQHRESHTPEAWIETYNASRSAGHFVAGVVALLWAFSALRSGKSGSREFDVLIIWCTILSLWMALSLSGLLDWWQHLRSDLLPPWLPPLA